MFTMGEDTRNIREAVIALRRAGKSRREIRAELGVSNRRLTEWLQGVPPAKEIYRHNAKDALRMRARELRIAGKTYDEIIEVVPVSKSTVSLWVRDLPKPPPRDPTEYALMMNERRWGPYRRQRDQLRAQTISDCAAEIGRLSDRELLVAGTALYWAEGGKRKPWSRSQIPIQFTNSDAGIIEIFERWLDLLGVSPEDRKYRISIHESADIDGAHKFWADLVGVGVDRFARPTIKRHNPKTVRHNTGDTYKGCLVIKIKKSAKLHDRIEGWWKGCVTSSRERRPVGRKILYAEKSSVPGCSAGMGDRPLKPGFAGSIPARGAEGR